MYLTRQAENRYTELQGITPDCTRSANSRCFGEWVASGVPVNLSDEKGNSLLMMAAYNGHEETARMIIEYSAELDLRNDHG